MSDTNVSIGSNRDTISRRDALKGLGGLLGASALPAGASASSSSNQSATLPAAGAKRPNILWITGEGIPLQVLSCYGSRLMQTPYLDRIAREGMRFENAFVTNALCGPSRATLLTGTYSNINGMVGNPEVAALPGFEVARFDPAQETLAKILKRNGYQTGMVGKWHLPVTPAQAGFDYFVYKQGAGGPYYDPSGYLANPALGSSIVEKRTFQGYETDVMTDLALKGIQQFTQPFLMMVQYFNAHRPFEPPHKYEHIYDGIRIPEPATFWDNYECRSTAALAARTRIEDMPDFNPPASLTGRQRKQWNYQKFMEHFLGTVRAEDDNIGRLLDFLDSSGLAENTVVIYTCDHGFFLGDHGWFDKRFMYEQAIRVPWMIRYPGHVQAGSVCSDWTVNIDNAPTALDIAGVPVPPAMQGRSLVSSFRGEGPKNVSPSFYYHYYEFGPPHWVQPHYGIRTERFKLISYYNLNEWELFDLQNDPDEMENLFLTEGYRVHPEYQAEAVNLVEQLKSLRQRYNDRTGAPVKLWPASE